ncbi:MAG: AraC family transcriptional regulator [Bacteroidota bacterium]|nr:AraC family transcriptional regulator [Bacteroidota bacterium]
MKLYIKNMISNRCKIVVKSELEKLGLHYTTMESGEVELLENVSAELQDRLNFRLKKLGFSLLNDKKSILIEKIKIIIIELVFSQIKLKTNFSDYLSAKLDYDYTYLANLFSENQHTTIEQFYLNIKIERVKELLIFDELNLTEIAYKLHYSSVAHLSTQFKKMTGLTPTQYKLLIHKRRNPNEKISESY